MIVGSNGEEGFKMEGNSLVSYLGSESIISIPEGCHTIESGAFTDSEVEEVTITKGVHLVKSGAFKNCRKLKKVILETVPEFEEDAFISCPYMGRVLKSIDDSKIINTNSNAALLATNGGKGFFCIRTTAFGSYIVGAMDRIKKAFPVDMRGVKETLSLLDKVVCVKKKSFYGCIIVSEGGTVTMYATLLDKYDIPYKMEIASLSKKDGFKSKLECLNEEQTNYVMGLLENIQDVIVDQVCESKDCLVELTVGKESAGLSTICEDTMFGSFENLNGGYAFFASAMI